MGLLLLLMYLLYLLIEFLFLQNLRTGALGVCQ
jgi:hypothetical protein